jgi:hypothetical protein
MDLKTWARNFGRCILGINKPDRLQAIIPYLNQNYSNAAIVCLISGSEGDFGSPERTKQYVRKTKSQSGSERGQNGVVFE